MDEADAASAFLGTNGSLTNMPNTQSEADAALDPSATSICYSGVK